MSAIVLPGVVAANTIAQIRKLMAIGPFVSGKLSAVGRAVSIKDNLLMAPNSPGEREAVELLTGALQASSAFQVAAWPEAMLRPQICRYAVGMAYGDHVDGAIMGQAPDHIRCDVALTVCLSDVSDYDGGELVIDTAGVPRSWKGNAGDAIVYPADTLHRVTPVTRGAREVAVSWIQSMVREPERRRILFDIRSVLDAMDQSATPPPEAETLRRSYFNLIRMWA
ncbi:MAG TPA: Fe2+-dependent dioxygenase [Polyangia bacterium]|nr:Fe2+-dependent dioxygenase [Polyangia bacterium]